MSLFNKNPLMQGATSLFCALSTLLFSTGIAAADTNSRSVAPSVSNNSTNAGPLVQFTSPAQSATTTSTTVEIKLRLKGPRINSHDLKIFANGKNVTNSFSIGDCPWGLCETSGRLTLGAELKSGWNHLVATVSTKSGAVGRSRLHFYEKIGVGDPTTGYAPPQSVHVAMSPTQGIEVDYTPDGGNAPYFYPGDYSACSPGQLTMIRLDRSTLAYTSTGCYGPNDNGTLQNDLKGFTEQDVLLASTNPGSALGQLNLSSIGGTDFTASNAPTAYSYSIIGYGQTSPGIAAESYNTTNDAAWHGLEGNLTDIGVTANGGNLYGFQPTGSAGFAVVPNGLNATVYVGNPQNLPIGTATLTNVPAGVFSYATYSAPPVTGSGGGLWVLVLDRYTLQLASSITYSARNADNSVNQSQVLDVLNGINQLDNNQHLVFITTLVGADTSGDYGSTPLNTEQEKVNQYTNLLTYIIRMGVSPYAFDRVMGLQWGLGYPASAFSMVGVPNQFIVNQLPRSVPNSGNSCAPPATSTVVCGANKDQWFSSALETERNESGALRGSLVRNRAFQYKPTDVSPFTPASTDTADTILSTSISHAVANAPLVAWPMTDTPGHKAAYGYLSNELNSLDMNSGNGCTVDAKYCQDIRFYYTGDQSAKIINGTDPKSITCPTDNPNFLQSDCNDVAQQLSNERSALGNVVGFQNAIETINNDESQNLALQLTKAANDVVNQVTQATNDDTTTVGDDPMSLSIDSLGVASGITGIIGVAFPPAGVLSGVLASAGGILSIIKDTDKSSVDNSKEVKTLSQLYTGSSTDAADAAITFNTNLSTSTGHFFDGIYSDWFKLETISALSINPDNRGVWYFENSNDYANYGAYLLASARKNFYGQILGQHFSTIYVQTYGYAPRVPAYSVIPGLYADANALWSKLVQKNNLSNVDHAYSWDYRDTFPYYESDDYVFHQDGVWDFNFVVLNNNHQQGWTDALGNTLMGPAQWSNDWDGSGNLNLNRDMLRDSGIFPTIQSTFWDSTY